MSCPRHGHTLRLHLWMSLAAFRLQCAIPDAVCQVFTQYPTTVFSIRLGAMPSRGSANTARLTHTPRVHQVLETFVHTRKGHQVHSALACTHSQNSLHEGTFHVTLLLWLCFVEVTRVERGQATTSVTVSRFL